MMETKIVAWTMGGSFMVAGMIFATKIIIAIGIATQQRMEQAQQWLLGEENSFTKNLGGYLWELIKGGVGFGS